jgi:hypothetical protein
VAHSDHEKLSGAFFVDPINDLPVLGRNHRWIRRWNEFGRTLELVTNGKWKGQKKRENNDRQE